MMILEPVVYKESFARAAITVLVCIGGMALFSWANCGRRTSPVT